MLTPSKVRTGVLVIHGGLALLLGLAYFYLRATMTNLLFEVFAVVIAMLLSAAALILAAITDWFAAFSQGMKSLHRITFYLLAGIAFALTGIFVGIYPSVSMRSLVVLASLHALAFGISALVFAYKTDQLLEGRAMSVFGILSVLFAGAMAGFVKDMDDPSATTVLGWYLCFVGAKVLFFAWDTHRTEALAGIRWPSGRRDGGVTHPRSSPANTIKP